MKFAALVAVLAEDMEDAAIDAARKAGAGGVTILGGRGIGIEAKKTFLGLTYEGSQAVLLFVLEKKLSVRVLKALTRDLDLQNGSKGVVFTLPLEHLAGIDLQQLERFESQLQREI